MILQYRNELKHLISPGDRAAICTTLKTVAKLDPHACSKGYYTIRSLYFDNMADKALREKIDGVNEREKFRIRYYDGDTSLIHLEKKVKRDGVGYKVSCDLSAEEARRIVSGDTFWMAADRRALGVHPLFFATMLHCIELSALAVQQCICLGEYPSPCVYSVQAQKRRAYCLRLLIA